MKLFDLHCDTIERMEELGENMLTDKTQLSLKYLPQIEKWCQTFAIFIPDSKRGADAVSYYEQVLAYFHKMLDQHADIVEMANTADDIRRITGSKKCAALLSVEGGRRAGRQAGEHREAQKGRRQDDDPDLERRPTSWPPATSTRRWASPPLAVRQSGRWSGRTSSSTSPTSTTRA